jgi:hypothetical protein
LLLIWFAHEPSKSFPACPFSFQRAYLLCRRLAYIVKGVVE